MQTVRWVVLAALGLSLGAAGALGGCSSDPTESAFDAGTLPDVALEGSDSGAAHDATPATDADSAASLPDQDAADSWAPPTGPDSSGVDDAGAPFDAGPGPSDAAPAPDAAGPDATLPVDAGSPEGGQASDGALGSDGLTDASGPDDAGDASDASASPFDAASLCATFDPATNPIVGVGAFALGQTLDLNTSAGANVDEGTAPFGEPVTIDVWTSPAAIVSSMIVVFTTDGFSTTTEVTATYAGASDAGIGSDQWTASLPAQPHGTTVAWYVRGYDYCTSSAQYYSNFSNNFHYRTP